MSLRWAYREGREGHEGHEGHEVLTVVESFVSAVLFVIAPQGHACTVALAGAASRIGQSGTSRGTADS